MIKISKKYLKKIIKKESRRLAENLPWSEESVASEIERAQKLDAENTDDLLDFDKDDPQEWQDWDVIVSGLSGFIMDKLQDTLEDPRDLNYVEREIEVPLLDMVKGLEGDVIEHLLKALGESPEGEDLTEEREMKISHKQLAKIIQEEVARMMSEEELNEEDKDWIQGAEKDIERRGTEGVCTGDKFGSDSCPPGSKRYNLAKTFRKMARDRKDK